MQKNRFAVVILHVMRVSFLQIATVLVFSLSSYADGTRAQSVLNKPVTITVDQQEIKTVFAMLKKQTGVKFTYSTNVIDVSRKISCSFRNTRLQEVLEYILTPLRLTYRPVDDEQIVLFASALSDIGVTGAQLQVTCSRLVEMAAEPL